MATTPIINPLVDVESKLDMGMWLNSVKVSAYATDILQIPGQKEKLLKALESNQINPITLSKKLLFQVIMLSLEIFLLSLQIFL